MLVDAILIFTPPNNTAHQFKEGKGSAKKVRQQVTEKPFTVDPHLSEHCGTEASSDMPNVRICEIIYFQWRVHECSIKCTLKI